MSETYKSIVDKDYQEQRNILICFHSVIWYAQFHRHQRKKLPSTTQTTHLFIPICKGYICFYIFIIFLFVAMLGLYHNIAHNRYSYFWTIRYIHILQGEFREEGGGEEPLSCKTHTDFRQHFTAEKGCLIFWKIWYTSRNINSSPK